MFNEAENLPFLFSELDSLRSELANRKVTMKVLFSDNSSSDSSKSLILEYLNLQSNVSLIALNRNYGYQSSLTNALRIVDSDALVVLQSDLQDPPNVILEFVERWQKNSANAVGGLIKKRSESFFDRSTRYVFYKLLNLFADKKHPSGLQDFYLITKKIYTEISKSPLDFQFLRSRIESDFGFDDLIPYVRQKRNLGKSKFKFSSKANLAFDGILANSARFRRGVSLLSILISCFSLFVLLAILIAFSFGWRSPVIGWVSLISIELITLSVMTGLFALTLEYVGRIYHIETKPTEISYELFE